MRCVTAILSLVVSTCNVLADGLPVITGQTSNQTVFTGNTASFFVTSSNATAFQWRFNGIDISGGTNSTLQLTNAQSTNSGYYMALAKNATGWTPSQLAYLSVVHFGSYVPFSNATNTGGQARDPITYKPINDGIAQVLAGPTLDYMVPTGFISFPINTWDTAVVTNGYFSLYPDDPADSFTTVDNVSPGQTVYFRVTITYAGGTRTLESTVVQAVAGDGGTYPIPSAQHLSFPQWPEWPEPILFGPESPPIQVRIPGETFTLGATSFYGYPDFGIPTWQWRKDGSLIGSPQLFTNMPQDNFTKIGSPSLTITNAQPSDAGIYDIVILGNNWFVNRSAAVSIQVTNGPGIFLLPRIDGSNFVADLEGAPGRDYQVQSTSDLATWNNLVVVSNVTGTVTFTDPLLDSGMRFYRATLVPMLFLPFQ